MSPNPLHFPGPSRRAAPEFGIAIAPVRNGAHVGICYLSPGGLTWFLHMAWHRDLRREPAVEAATNYAIGNISLHPLRRYVAAQYLEHLWASCEARVIPYGIGVLGVRFDAAGALVMDSGVTGLTCATFVARALEGAGVEVVALDTWTAGRPGDSQWREFVADALEQHHVPPEHVAAIRADTAAARLRPEEVAYACTAEPEKWPMPLGMVEGPAVELMASVVANCPPLA